MEFLILWILHEECTGTRKVVDRTVHKPYTTLVIIKNYMPTSKQPRKVNMRTENESSYKTRVAITSPRYSGRNYLEEEVYSFIALHHMHTHNQPPTYFFSYLPYTKVDYHFMQNMCAQPL